MPVVELSPSAVKMSFGSNADYATARGTARSYYTPTEDDAVCQFFAEPTYSVGRMFLSFDTSFLPADAIVRRLAIRLTALYIYTDRNFDLEIVKVPALSSDSFAQALVAPLVGLWRNTADVAAETPYDSPDLDPTCVNHGGPTVFGLCTSLDRDADAPTGTEVAEMCLPDNPTPEYRPVLTVDYLLPRQLRHATVPAEPTHRRTYTARRSRHVYGYSGGPK